MTNLSGTLYTGATNNLQRRVDEHRSGLAQSFTSKYRIMHLVFFETTNNVKEAIAREKEIKDGSREKKAELVNGMNPEWQDLSDEL